MEKELAQSNSPSQRKVPKTIRSTIRGSFGWCFGDGQLLDSSCIVEAFICQLIHLDADSFIPKVKCLRKGECMEKRIKVRVKNGIHRTAVQSVKLMISLNHQLDKTCLEDPLYKLSSSQMLNKIMLYLILTMHHFSDGFPFLPHYLEKDIMKNEHQRDHKMLLGYKIQSQKPEMEVALYLCFTKTREILGNLSLTPERFPEVVGFAPREFPQGPTAPQDPPMVGHLMF